MRSASHHRTYSRAVTLLVLGALLLTVCAAVYLFVAQPVPVPLTVEDENAYRENALQLSADARRLVTLLTILLMSALLILLFVVGAYLVIRVGQLIARTRVGGRPTEYVDAWRSYRLSDEQIRAATEEDPHADGSDAGPAAPGSPQSPDPDNPPPED